ncbi:hypothetical protein MY9_3853 [Bacillus sp. JS]|nr:hypothetical protein MY9_3853 [Bacillus sp. JS]
MPAVYAGMHFLSQVAFYPQRSYFQINPSYIQITVTNRKTIK